MRRYGDPEVGRIRVRAESWRLKENHDAWLNFSVRFLKQVDSLLTIDLALIPWLNFSVKISDAHGWPRTMLGTGRAGNERSSRHKSSLPLFTLTGFFSQHIINLDIHEEQRSHGRDDG
jgi:hypothetical protein